MTTPTPQTVTIPPNFTRLVDLAVARNGGAVEEASDDFFAPKERLILLEEPVSKPGLYTENGKWMDGWESRRRRIPGNDWCIVRLGLPGRIQGVDIDTRHFVGNHPPEASLDATHTRSGEQDNPEWTPILARVPLKPDSHNFFDVTGSPACTHVRLNIFPDGGVARLRVFGDVEADWSTVGPDEVIELSCLSRGGAALECNDEHFGRMMNLLREDHPLNMGDGWETRRRRTPGHDWVIVRLGCAGRLDRIEIDTTHFKGNYPDRFSVDASLTRSGAETDSSPEWVRILNETKLEPDRQHVFAELLQRGPFTHARLNIYPDGGVARLRVFGRPTLESGG